MKVIEVTDVEYGPVTHRLECEHDCNGSDDKSILVI